MQDNDLLYKVCVIGDSGVGKSCIIQRFADDEYSERFTSTVGVDFKTKTIRDKDGKVVRLHIWDTAGQVGTLALLIRKLLSAIQERFRSVTANSFRGAHGIVYAYDITDRESFLNIKRVWADEVAQKLARPNDVLKLLVGNKCDLSPSRRAVPYQEAEEYAKEAGMPFLETSAKNDVGIGAVFQVMW